jgi:hypothetical protein
VQDVGVLPSVKTWDLEGHRNHEAESNEWKKFKPKKVVDHIMHASVLFLRKKDKRILDDGHDLLIVL